MALNAVNWTRVKSRGNRSTVCLSTEQPAIEARCARREAHRKKAKASSPSPSSHSSVEVALVSRHGSVCTVTQQLLPFQTPPAAVHRGRASGRCVSAGEQPDPITMSRYLYNHGHQAEYLVPMLDDAVLHGEAPRVLHWYWRRTHWITQLLRVMLPFTTLDTSRRPSKPCRTYKPLGSGGGGRHWLQHPRTAQLMRRALLRHCGLRDRSPAINDATGRPRERVVVLLRGDSQQPNATTAVGSASILDSETVFERRPFANLSDVLRTLRMVLPRSSVRIATTQGNATICEQARWVHGASVVLSPHGAHLTNGLWMAKGSLLIEAMPWGMWQYEGYAGLFKAGGISHARIRAQRPPPAAPHWRNPDAGDAQEHDQARCARTQDCRLFYRARSMLHVQREELCRVLRKHLPASRGLGGDCAPRRDARRGFL